MEEILQILLYPVAGFVGLIWLYVAARIIARAIIRSIKESKKEDE